MEAGKLDKRVTIQRPSGTRDAFGEEELSWIDYATVWAMVRPLSGRELWNAKQVQPDVTHEVTVRFIDGVTPRMRLLYRDRILNIASVINVDEADTELQLVCVEPING